MKTILHISKYYYPDLGGIESVARFLAENLKDFNNEVVCFATDKSQGINYISGIPVHRVKVQMNIKSQDIAIGYNKKLKELISKCKPDIIVLHCPNPYLYPIVLNLINKDTKLVVLWHSDILAKGMLYRLIKPFETKLLKRADYIIATSEEYVKHSSVISPYSQKVIVLQNTVNTSMFEKRKEDEKKIRNIKKKYQDKKIVFFVGRHIKYKGIDKLIEAEKFVNNDCVFVIAGSGVLTEELKSQANGRERIYFVGRLSDDDLRCYLYASDIFAFSSIYKAEAFGVALAEAMYCGAVPVTFTIKGSGVNWVSLNGVTGEEVPLNDVKAYAKAIDKLLEDDELRKKYSLAAQERINNMFNDTTVADSANQMFLTVASQDRWTGCHS